MTYTISAPNSQVCTTAEIPNAQDRKFFNSPSSVFARTYTSGVEGTVSALPVNPMVEPSASVNVNPLASATKAFVDSLGGPCGLVAYYEAIDIRINWLYTADTSGGKWEYQEVYPGTNTPGVAECNF